jgi:hypothetical protein
LLESIEEAYQAVARVELAAYRRLDLLQWVERFGPPRRLFPGWLPTDIEHDPAARARAPADPLVVSRVVFESPGFWEFLGNLNPLEVLRNYLNDRHEREKDREYRSAAERERLAIANALGRLEVYERPQLPRPKRG